MNPSKLHEIAAAWIHAYNPTPEQQRLAEERLEICDTCEYQKRSVITDSLICNACGCPISKKIFSPRPGIDACPHAKWPR